jgi:hypothetical protein
MPFEDVAGTVFFYTASFSFSPGFSDAVRLEFGDLH